MVWPGVVSSGEEFGPSPSGGSEWWRFDLFLAVNHAILEQNCFGNNYEGSIPFTRSIDKQGLTKMCKYSASDFFSRMP